MSEPTNNLFHCNSCEYKSTSKYDLVKHKRTRTADRPFECSQCPYSSATPSNLKRHMRIHTREKQFQCSECSYTCARSDTLYKHMRKHTGEKPYECDECQYTCAQKYSLHLHKQQKHTLEKLFKCSKCTYESTTRNDVIKHERIHAQEKPFKCSICGFRCSDHSNLKVHKRKHTGEKPYKCNICSYKCAHSSSLKRHVEIMHPDPADAVIGFLLLQKLIERNQNDTTSNEENLAFVSPSNIHQDTSQKCALSESTVTSESENPESQGAVSHPPEAQNIKGRSFGQLDQHRVYRVSDTKAGSCNARPYVCGVCRKSFRRENRLRVHIRIHTSEKPHECPACNK